MTAPAAPPAHHVDLLRGALVAHLATVRPDGTPQSNPVWFRWSPPYVELSQIASGAKVRNMRVNPAVSLSILDPANPFRFLEVRGEVDDIVPDPDKSFLRALIERYTGKPAADMLPAEERVVVRIAPTRFAHEKGYVPNDRDEQRA